MWCSRCGCRKARPDRATCQHCHDYSLNYNRNHYRSRRQTRPRGSCPERAARIVWLLLNDPGAKDRFDRLIMR